MQTFEQKNAIMNIDMSQYIWKKAIARLLSYKINYFIDKLGIVDVYYGIRTLFVLYNVL